MIAAVTNGAYSAGVCNATLSGGTASVTYKNFDSDGSEMTAGQLLAKAYDGTTKNYFAGVAQSSSPYLFVFIFSSNRFVESNLGALLS